MKTVHIKTGKCELVVVEFSKDVKIEKGYVFEYIDDKIITYSHKLINKLSDITEEQAKELVDEGDATPNSDMYKNGYKSYLTGEDDYWCETSLESLHSLLEANGVCFENPLEINMMDGAFEYYESKVFDKSITYLFKKI